MTTHSQVTDIFIASSSEAKNVAQELQVELEDNGASSVTIWHQDDFQLSCNTLECLIQNGQKYDFVIILLTPDIEMTARNETSYTARPNVLFEAGLFIGMLGRKRTFMVIYGNKEVELPSDIDGMTIVKIKPRQDGNIQAAITKAVVAIRKAISNEGKKPKQSEKQYKSLFTESDSGEFVEYVSELIEDARKVILMGIGLNILHRDPLRNKLFEHAAKNKCTLEIYLADPYSPLVENRLIEEESGQNKPPIGRGGLKRRLVTILDEYQHLGSPTSISIKLFSNYPTFSLLIVDNKYFIYPYSYATIGNYSPVIHLSQDFPSHQKVTQFFDKHYERVKSTSVDAALKMELYEGIKLSKEILHSFAIYFVPPADSSFYKFGSNILGYNCRDGVGIPSDWAAHVGEAQRYGFHLTICDALYFFNQTEVALAWHEATFIIKDYDSFELENLRVIPKFPDNHSIAIIGNDRSGTLEALHCEFVTRLYRRAAASNYSLGISSCSRDDEIKRAKLMIERFKAPYILKSYRPHITLLTKVRSEDMDGFTSKLDDLLSIQLPSRKICIEKLALMQLPSLNSAWKLVSETNLRTGIKNYE